MKPVYILLVLLFGFTTCRHKEKRATEVISVLQEMEEIATVEYTVTKVVKANDNKTWFKPGDRKILMTTEATLKAGINLAELKPENITVAGKSITVQLPEPRILSVNMPPEKIKVAFEKSDLLRYPFSNEERDGLLKQAEQQLRNSGNETGILTQARVNTQLLMGRLLKTLGFETITLRFGEAEKKKGQN